MITIWVSSFGNQTRKQLHHHWHWLSVCGKQVDQYSKLLHSKGTSRNSRNRF